MALVKKLVWFIVLLLFLEVVQRIIEKMNFAGSFFVSTLIGCIELLAIFFFLFYVLFRRKRMSVIVLSFFLLIALAEGLFAWLIYHPDSIPGFLTKSFEYYYNNYELDMEDYHKRLSVYNPRVFYTLKPGLNDIFETNEFKTSIAANNKGLRDDDSSLQRPAIICLGDSYTMGWGVEHSESYAQRLERLSGQKVLNAGIASYGTARQMILLQELDTSALTHLVIQYCSNDYHENNQYIRNNNRLAITSRAAYDTMVNRRKQATGYFPGKYFLVTTKAFFKLKWLALSGKNAVKKQDEKEHARVFMKLLSESPINFTKVKVVVCSVGDLHDFGPGVLQQVDSLAKAQPGIFHNNLTVVNVLSRLEEKDWYKLDWHLRPSGHQKIADMLWETIRRH